MMKGRGAATGLGASQGGGASTTAEGTKKPCYFFNHGTCKNSDADCKFAHVHVSPAEKAKMEKPQRAGSPARSPRRNTQGDDNRPREGAKMHCFKFLKGTCTLGDKCSFAHMDEAVVKEMERANKARAKAKAKGQPKAKAKATAAKSGIAVPVAEE